MHQYTEKFVEYCKKELDLTKLIDYNYNSLPICIIDCVYSLRTKYEKTTRPIVQRYADWALNGDTQSAEDRISLFLQRIDEVGLQEFRENIVDNRQKLGGVWSIPKEEVCYNLARYLKYINIETLENFQKFESPEFLEIVIRAVKGIGDAGTNYLFMLAGDKDRCKPDVHVNHCIKDVCGCELDNDETQALFTDTVSVLKKDYPELTVSRLDGIIWRKYATKSENKK